MNVDMSVVFGDSTGGGSEGGVREGGNPKKYCLPGVIQANELYSSVVECAEQKPVCPPPPDNPPAIVRGGKLLDFTLMFAHTAVHAVTSTCKLTQGPCLNPAHARSTGRAAAAALQRQRRARRGTDGWMDRLVDA